MSTVAARFRRRWRRLWTPPRRLKTTPTGRTFVLLTLGVGLGALNTGNNLLYLVLGLQLATIIASGILSEGSLRTVRVRRVLPEAPHARADFHLAWALSRPRGHGFALGVSEVHPLLGSATGRLAWLPPGEERTVRAVARVGRRGPLRLEAVRVSTRWPLGLFVKSRDVELPGELVLLPARVPAPVDVPDTLRGVGTEPRPRPGASGEGDLAQLRELRLGEDARRVHWAKSAQLGTLLRIDRDAQPNARVVLQLDDRAPPEALDPLCERLAAEAEALLARGADVGLETTSGLKLAPSNGATQARAVLRALALAGHGRTP